MMNLPTIIRLKLPQLAEYALRMDPTAIRNMNMVAALRGPMRSVSIPLGICISVYAYR